MSTIKKFQNVIQRSSPFISFDLSELEPIVKEIHQFHQNICSYSDEQLRSLAESLSAEAKSGKALDDLLVSGYALVKEVFIRKMNLKAYDVQLMAAIALHRGHLIEMQTGEGKTLTAVFPAFLNALSGKSVHILTFNDYLAERDAKWMQKVYDFLGISVGFIQQGLSSKAKKAAYGKSVCYATAKELGFDYLRCFIAYETEALVLADFHFAIVDEADALLIDEARNPLVLAGKFIHFEFDFHKIARFVANFELKTDYEIDGKNKSIYFTENGASKIKEHFPEVNFEESNHQLLAAVNLALRAKILLKRDIHYVIRNDKIKLVDEFTGRIVEDRKWRNGLQTAVEAKEQLPLQSEGGLLNSISLQHFLQKYPKLAGMTATAQTAAEEFNDFYKLKTLVIPPNKTCLRIDHPDLIFTSLEAKNKAILEEIQRVHSTGQAILIGTLTVRESESLARQIQQLGINCKTLNAKNDQEEAAIVARAGKLGAVTISTNMAGRGTDIKLGAENPEEKQKLIQLGGLYVLGTNRHESKRIDQQLRGRAARQGDPGESRFFISFEDDLMLKYELEELLPKQYKALQSHQPISDEKVLQRINLTQRSIESKLYDVRKALYQYSSFVELQRKILQEERQKILADPHYYYTAQDKPFPHLPHRPEIPRRIQEIILQQYDECWAEHLEYLSEVRDGIHVVRLGGQRPLNIFRKKADEHFQQRCNIMDKRIRKKVKLILENPDISPEALGSKRPTSTWTYIINDNPFKDQLAIMLLDSGNIGMQVDFLSAPFLFARALIQKWKQRRD